MGAVLGTLTRVADYIFRFLFGGHNEEAVGVTQGGLAGGDGTGSPREAERRPADPALGSDRTGRSATTHTDPPPGSIEGLVLPVPAAPPQASEDIINELAQQASIGSNGSNAEVLTDEEVGHGLFPFEPSQPIGVAQGRDAGGGGTSNTNLPPGSDEGLVLPVVSPQASEIISVNSSNGSDNDSEDVLDAATGAGQHVDAEFTGVAVKQLQNDALAGQTSIGSDSHNNDELLYAVAGVGQPDEEIEEELDSQEDEEIISGNSSSGSDNDSEDVLKAAMGAGQHVVAEFTGIVVDQLPNDALAGQTSIGSEGHNDEEELLHAAAGVGQPDEEIDSDEEIEDEQDGQEDDEDQGPPLTRRACHYVRELFGEIETLSNSLYLVKIPEIKMSKADVIASYVSDRKQLAMQEEVQSIRISPSSHPYLYVGPTERSCKRGREIGYELVFCRGVVAIPTCSRTGLKDADKMNELLFSLFNRIDELFEDVKAYSLLVQTGFLSLADLSKDCKHAYNLLRRTCRSVRSRILSLGFMPLVEPRDLWSLKVEGVKNVSGISL